MDRKLLKEYAKLVVEKGLIVKPGKQVYIQADLNSAEFVRLVTDAAYESGARTVTVKWSDEYVNRQHWLKAAESEFEAMKPWTVAEYDAMGDSDTSILMIHSEDPTGLTGVDPKRFAMWNKAYGEGNRKFRADREAGKIPWCVAGYPSLGWAKGLFPDLSDEEAFEKLGEGILASSRVEEGKTLKNWDDHVASLLSRCEKLNAYHFESLHYKNSIGTDLVVKLPKTHVWAGGKQSAEDGGSYVPNIPTEEIFAGPQWDGVDGVLYSTMPLFRNGNLIDGMRFEFENGRIVKFSAEVGEEFLKDAIEMDERSHYLGEAALVPYSSPIRRSGIIYRSTLYDENASCHFAIGSAYAETVEGGTHMSTEELRAAGLNADAKIHIDFMVGSADLSIVGTTADGRQIPVFIDGEFAPEFR